MFIYIYIVAYLLEHTQKKQGIVILTLYELSIEELHVI